MHAGSSSASSSTAIFGGESASQRFRCRGEVRSMMPARAGATKTTHTPCRRGAPGRPRAFAKVEKFGGVSADAPVTMK